MIRKSCSRARPAGVSAPAMCCTRSSSRVPLTSSAPKCSAIDAVSSPRSTQYASTWGKLSSRSRAAAIVLKLSAARGARGPRPGGPAPLGAAPAGRRDRVGPRDEGEKTAGAVLLLAQLQQVIDALGVALHVAVEHRRVGPDAERVGDAVDLAPAIAVGLAGVAQLLGQAGGEDLGA